MSKHCYRIVLAAALLAGACVSVREGHDPTAAGMTPQCLEAVVNPVSGHAECVNPAGAAVQQPHRGDVPCPPQDADSNTNGQRCSGESTGDADKADD
jgi:hypothetical protein